MSDKLAQLIEHRYKAAALYSHHKMNDAHSVLQQSLQEPTIPSFQSTSFPPTLLPEPAPEPLNAAVKVLRAVR